MALTPEEIKKVNEEFNQLINRLDETEQRSLRQVREDLANGRKNLEQWNREITKFKDSLDKISDNLSYATTAFKNITEELKAGNDGEKLLQKQLQSRIASLNKVSNIARQALEVRRGDVNLSDKQLKNLQLRNERERDNLIRLTQVEKITDERRAQLEQEIADTEAVGNSIQGIVDRQKEVNKQLGFAPALAAGLDKALQKAGLPALGISDALAETQKEAQRRAQEGEEAAKNFNPLVDFSKRFSENLAEATSLTNLLQVGFALVLNNALALNKTQTEFRRLTGETATNLNEYNTALISTNDQLKTMVGLTEQFGFNANVAFDAINIQEATELRELMGLSAEEANNLAYFAQASGTNLKEAASNIYDGVDGAFSQKKILQDVGNVSTSIAMTFGGNLELMGETANEAKRLGLNLQQVDKIADGLLDIETSIRNEFEAEVITGKQLNLERARFFALTNDINGLTKEIGNNQEFINTFATGTRIEQQAIAESLNLSRDEVSKMIFDQAIANELTTEEAAKRADMSIEDAKRLTLQQSITKSVEKLTEALAGPLEAFAALADNAFVLYTTLGLIGTISLARTIGSLITMATSLATSAGFATATSAALTLGGSALAIVAAVALVGSAMAAFNEKTKQNVQDGIAPASKGPFTITDSFGATAITAKGDGLAVSPNIITPLSPTTEKGGSLDVSPNIITPLSSTIERRDGRNDGMQLDYDKLASAIAKGAEAGTSRARLTARVDNRQFASNQQTAQVIEQYRFSS
jgi:hypothetical protein